MKKMDRILKEWIIPIVIATIFVAVIYQIIWPMRVDGHSMEETLSNNDLVIVYKLGTKSKVYERGDIIVAKIDGLDGHQKVVKRIIGIQGDHIVIDKGVITINGQEIQEPYVSSMAMDAVDLFVPKNSYYLLGDNRLESADSRSFGCIKKEAIVGKVIYSLGPED